VVEVEEGLQVCNHIHWVYYRVIGMFICIFLGLCVDDVLGFLGALTKEGIVPHFMGRRG
jgi:hypothetical protein